MAIKSNGLNCYLEITGFTTGKSVHYMHEDENKNRSLIESDFYLIDRTILTNQAVGKKISPIMSAYIYDQIRPYVFYYLPIDSKYSYEINVTLTPSSYNELSYCYTDAILNTNGAFINTVIQSESAKTLSLTNGQGSIEVYNVNKRALVIWRELTISEFINGTSSIECDVFPILAEQRLGLFFYEKITSTNLYDTLKFICSVTPSDFTELYVSKMPTNLTLPESGTTVISSELNEALLSNQPKNFNKSIENNTIIFSWQLNGPEEYDRDGSVSTEFLVWGKSSIVENEEVSIVNIDVENFPSQYFTYATTSIVNKTADMRLTLKFNQDVCISRFTNNNLIKELPTSNMDTISFALQNQLVEAQVKDVKKVASSNQNEIIYTWEESQEYYDENGKQIFYIVWNNLPANSNIEIVDITNIISELFVYTISTHNNTQPTVVATLSINPASLSSSIQVSRLPANLTLPESNADILKSSIKNELDKNKVSDLIIENMSQNQIRAIWVEPEPYYNLDQGTEVTYIFWAIGNEGEENIIKVEKIQNVSSPVIIYKCVTQSITKPKITAVCQTQNFTGVKVSVFEEDFSTSLPTSGSALPDDVKAQLMAAQIFPESSSSSQSNGKYSVTLTWTAEEATTNTCFVFWSVEEKTFNPAILSVSFNQTADQILLYDTKNYTATNSDIHVQCSFFPAASFSTITWGLADGIDLPGSGQSYNSEKIQSFIQSLKTIKSYSTSGSATSYEFENSKPDDETHTHIVWARAEVLFTSPSLSITNITSEACLTGATLITLANGTQKRLDELTNDDIVLGQTGPTKIVRLIQNGPQNYITRHYFDNGAIIEEVGGHPFYNKEENFYKLLSNWDIGEHGLDINNMSITLLKSEKTEELSSSNTLWTESGTYYANGVLGGDQSQNRQFLAEASLDKIASMLGTLTNDQADILLRIKGDYDL